MVVSTDDPIEDLLQNFATASRIVSVDPQDGLNLLPKCPGNQIVILI